MVDNGCDALVPTLGNDISMTKPAKTPTGRSDI
jgi:hypothetical protein